MPTEREKQALLSSIRRYNAQMTLKALNELLEVQSWETVQSAVDGVTATHTKDAPAIGYKAHTLASAKEKAAAAGIQPAHINSLVRLFGETKAIRLLETLTATKANVETLRAFQALDKARIDPPQASLRRLLRLPAKQKARQTVLDALYGGSNQAEPPVWHSLYGKPTPGQFS